MTLDILTWIFSASLIHIMCVAFVMYYCLIRRRDGNSSLLWIFLTWSFPLFGFLLFLFFGLYRLPRKGWEKHCSDQRLLSARETRERSRTELFHWHSVHDSAVANLDLEAHPFAALFNRAIDAIDEFCPLLAGNRVSLLVDGDQAYPQMLEAISRARHHVHLQSFIIGNDEVGRQFLDALAERARHGVQVKVMYDNLGCTKARWGRLFAGYRKIPNFRLLAWTQLNPFKLEFQVNLRNHRKILVVDGREAFVGGLNISRHNLAQAGQAPIRDYHFHVQGPAVQDLQYAFLRDWHYMAEDEPADLLTKAHFPELQPRGQAAVRVINSGPTADEMEAIANVFFNAITVARQSVLIVTPYFVPFRDILQALRGAAMRGVRVRIVVPSQNNHVYAGWAGRSLYEELLRAGVEVYERRPPFIHAKAMLVDGALALVGTANLDACSLRLDYETNIAVFDESLVRELQLVVEREIADSQRIELNEWLRRPTHNILMENFCGLLSPIL